MTGIGIIGCGRFGRRLAAVLAANPKLEVVAAADVNREAAETLAAEFDAQLALTYEELLDTARVDAVVVATSHGSHERITTAAARAGKHIFCEKPMALTVDECIVMANAARDNGVELVVGHLEREFSVVREARRLLSSGELGAPVAMLTTRYHWLPRYGWWSERAEYGGMVYSPAVHNLDLLNYFLGLPKSVFAQAAPQVQPQLDYSDSMFVQVMYASHAIGCLAATLSSRSNGPMRGVNSARITCESGAIEYSLEHPTGLWYAIDDRPPIHIELLRGAETVDFERALARELDNFADCISGDAMPFIPVEDAIRAVQLCEAAMRSADERAVIELPSIAAQPAFG